MASLPGKTFKYLRMDKNRAPYDVLNHIGIDCANCSWDRELLTGEVIVLIDDAQNSFNSCYKSFWTSLMKNITLPDNIRFVIAASYLIGGEDSPGEFSKFPRIGPEEMLLSVDESFEFLVNYLQFPHANMTSLVDLIVTDCGGNIGALAITSDQIECRFAHQIVDERILKDFFISSDLTQQMDRLFGGATDIKLEEEIMIDLLYEGKIEVSEAELENSAELKRYLKSGFLIRTGRTMSRKLNESALFYMEVISFFWKRESNFIVEVSFVGNSTPIRISSCQISCDRVPEGSCLPTFDETNNIQSFDTENLSLS